ncbi:MAG: O-methyltransferase [Candidatus Bathyarchaeota archaeon]
MGSKSREVLKSIERNAWREYFPIIGPKKGKILVDAIHKIKPKRILEIGTLIGYSIITMAQELDSNAEIISVEIDEGEAEHARENIRKAEVKPRVKILIGDALDIIPQLDGIFDMVFIDAEKSEYLDYLRLIEGNLNRGSVIVADNTNIPTSPMRKYLDYVRNNGGYESKAVCWGEMEVSVKL